MKTLWEHVLPLHQAFAGIGRNYTLSYLSKENVDLIDGFNGELEIREKIRATIRDLGQICADCFKNLSDHNRFVDLKNGFAELLIYVKLCGHVEIKKIAESATKSPDFQLKFEGLDFYLELKALNVAGGQSSLESMTDDSIRAQIDLENQVDAGKRVAFSEQVIQPYYRAGQPYDPQSTNMVTEILIDKISSNVKSGQYELGTTGLIIDLSEQLLLHGNADSNLNREFSDPPDFVPQSGELWHVAFGSPGMRMKKAVSFLGENDADKLLTKMGILNQYPFIAGIMFHYSGNFWGAAIRRRNNINFIKLMEKICVKVVSEPESV